MRQKSAHMTSKTKALIHQKNITLIIKCTKIEVYKILDFYNYTGNKKPFDMTMRLV